jgi:hypothetical protein
MFSFFVFRKSGHFGMVAATALKTWRRGHLQWHELPTKFHKNLPIYSEIETGKDTQTGW